MTDFRRAPEDVAPISSEIEVVLTRPPTPSRAALRDAVHQLEEFRIEVWWPVLLAGLWVAWKAWKERRGK